MTAIETCRTAALGGHVEQCDACGHQRIAYNSCANRHCPKCQSLARAAWIDARTADLLDVEYFHVVFTIPEPIAAIALQNKAQVYGILFRATADTFRTIAADPQHLGATIGFFAVLHTWGQTLAHHPHLHCVVPGGGLSPDGTRWIACRPGFFLPVRVLSRLFRRLFLEGLQAAFDTGPLHFAGALHALADPDTWARAVWPPSGRPSGSSTPSAPSRDRHRSSSTSAATRTAWPSPTIGCSTWTMARCGSPTRTTAPIAAQAVKTMTLAAAEFIRRFLLHVLPTGFHRIRYYGFLGARHRRATLARCRQLLGSTTPLTPPTDAPPSTDYRDRTEALTGQSLRVCPVCHHGAMILIQRLVPLARTGCVPSDTS